jgi:serine/alanine adding enzyme
MLTARDGEPVGDRREDSSEKVVGVLPVVHLRHALFGNDLVSLPFFDGGGILADSREAEERLLAEVISLGQRIGASKIELRHERPPLTDDLSELFNKISPQLPSVATRSNKVRMLLNLPPSAELLMKSFKSKLRSQISKPLKEGLTSKTGGVELLEDFYRVFLVNMRDLGSPVHSIKLMERVLKEFAKLARIVAVYKGKEPIAAALVIGFKQVLRNPWASSLRTYASLSPNMLLYLRLLEYACESGHQTFDFGRSTMGEGTYRFKEQWGAAPSPLYWHYLSLGGALPDTDVIAKARFERATRLWQKLPLIVTRVIGPGIRKHISL